MRAIIRLSPAPTLPSRPGGLEKQDQDQDARRRSRRDRSEMHVADRRASRATPMRMPPSAAPGILPMPPSTAATKALRPGMHAHQRIDRRVAEST